MPVELSIRLLLKKLHSSTPLQMRPLTVGHVAVVVVVPVVVVDVADAVVVVVPVKVVVVVIGVVVAVDVGVDVIVVPGVVDGLVVCVPGKMQNSSVCSSAV